MRHLLTYQYLEAIVRAGSIRKAAETLAITSTALNRRILALEEELGEDLFERLAKGVRLSTAGEVFYHFARSQLKDLERVKSHIADLKGERRGHVAIACSQAMLTSYLPEEIAYYRKQHPAVTFEVQVRDRSAAEQALLDVSADLALVFEPVQLADFQVIFSVKQPVYALLPVGHPLSGGRELTLQQCREYPLALPTQAYGVRKLLELSARRGRQRLRPDVESDSFEFLRYQTIAEGVITFQIEMGLPLNLQDNGLVAIRLSEQDVAPGMLYIGQLKGRTLPVAAAKFANQLINSLDGSSLN